MTALSKKLLEQLLPPTQAMAREAGKIIMGYYTKGADIEIKQDGSPVTDADYASHKHIAAKLKALTPSIPIISEEDEKHPAIPYDGRFWTVDPLDGTKGFIEKSDQFFVKIALLDNFKPVLGIVYQPATGQLYFSVKGGKAWRQDAHGQNTEIKTKPAPQKGKLKTLFNALFHDPKTYDLAHKKLSARGLKIEGRKEATGSYKSAFNMTVAEGAADAFLGCGTDPALEGCNGFSWDYAPDWLILKNAGGIMLEIKSGKEPVFNKPTRRMNAMISLGDKELGKKCFPELKNDCV